MLSQPEEIMKTQNDPDLEGKRIRKITIRILNVAGYSIEDMSYDSTWFNETINSIHIKTRPHVIKERLLFKLGDTLNYISISESERLLRSTNLFSDVKIKIFQSEKIRNDVEVEVITRDKWSLTYLAAYKPNNITYLGLKDNNFIGLGHKADVLVTRSENKLIGWGGRLRYTAPNINGSYADLSFKLEANKKRTYRSLSLIRPFITYETEWIGGFELIWDQDKHNFINQSEFQSLSVKKNIQDFWAGKSFVINPFTKDINSNIIITARVSSLNFSERPFSPFDYRIFENSTIYLIGAGLVNRSFYKDNFVEGFGITEDIPVGNLISISVGPEERELSTRWYLGAESIYSTNINRIGYVSGRLGIGAFKNINTWEQNTYNLNFIYHSFLNNIDNWKYRFISSFDLLLGYNRISGEEIYLSSTNGLRGIDETIPGSKRAVINFESRIFSPYSVLGFLIGGISFVDVGLIAAPNKTFFSSRLYQSYGVGLRVGNESIVNSTFGLSVIFNPYNPKKNGAAITILFSTNIILGVRPLDYFKPLLEGFGEY